MKIEEEIKSRFRNEYHKAFVNLIYTEKSLNYQFIQLIKKYGLTEPQYNILRILRGARKAVSINYLKERMLDKSSDVSRIIDRLLNKGFVKREENPRDRRQKNIAITDNGLTALAEMDSCESKLDSLLKNLTSEEVSELNRLLDKIRE